MNFCLDFEPDNFGEFEPKSNCKIIGAIVGGIGAIGSLVSGIIGSNAAKSAANTQANAANKASAQQLAMFNTINANLAPYRNLGAAATGPLATLTGTAPGTDPTSAYLTAPFAPTEANLAATPGYQFTLDQGLQATTNAAAAMGLGKSGSLLKGIDTFSTGLADQTYNTRFAQDLQSRQQMASLLQNLVGTGQNAAAMTGQFGQNATTTANNFLTSGAAAQAGGQIGSANALTGAIGGISSNALLATILANSPQFNGQNNSIYQGNDYSVNPGLYPPPPNATLFNSYQPTYPPQP